MSSNNGKRMFLQKFVLLRQPANVNDMYRRNLKINTSMETIVGIENMLNKHHGFLDISLLSNSPDIILLNPDISGPIVVEGGWNEDRLSYIMSVVVQDANLGKNTFYFLTGYTDFYNEALTKNITNVRQLDNRMRFNINSITVIEELKSSIDGKPYYKFLDEITLVKNNGTSHFDNYLNNDYLLRPVDILSALQDYDLGTNITAEPTEIAKTNINPITYMENIMSSIQDGIKLEKSKPNAETSHELGTKQALGSISTLAEQRETPMMNCPFLMVLYRTVNESSDTGTAKPANFNINNLIDIFGYENVDAVTEIHFYNSLELERKNANKYSTSNMDNVLLETSLSNTLAPTIENLIALEFYYMASTYLYHKKITQAIVTLSNHPKYVKDMFTVNGSEVAMLMEAYSYFHHIFASPDKLNEVDVYLRNVILPKITKKFTNNRINVHLVADMDLLGNSTIAVVVEGGYRQVYRYNSSMDNNFTPIVGDKKNFDNMIAEVSTLVDVIYSN